MAETVKVGGVELPVEEGEIVMRANVTFTSLIMHGMEEGVASKCPLPQVMVTSSLRGMECVVLVSHELGAQLAELQSIARDAHAQGVAKLAIEKATRA